MYPIKIILIGNSGVGKSSLVLQFTDRRFDSENCATIGVEYGSRILKIDDNDIKLCIWDTAGQERYRSITRSYYRRTHGVILVYDITNRHTFQAIRDWLTEIRENTDGKPEILLLANKVDIEKIRIVSKEEGIDLAKEYNFMFYETSAKTGVNVEQAIIHLAHKIWTNLEENICTDQSQLITKKNKKRCCRL